MRVQNSTSYVSIEAFPEVANLGCPNAMLNQPKCQIRNLFLIAKFGNICVFSRKIAIFSLNMYTLRNISPRPSERTLEK